MDYEEKYRKLVDAIKEMRDVNPSDEGLQNWISDNVPELAESEDERIRKAIIAIISNYVDNSNTFKPKMLAWLEKQETSYTKKDVDDAYLKGISDAKNEFKKQYEANYQIRKDIATFIFNYSGDIKDRAKWMDYLGVKVYVFEKEDEKPQGKSALQAAKEEKVDNANKNVVDFKAEDYYISKVDGKIHNMHSSSNIKLKFHEGEWIIHQGTENIYQVVAVIDNQYQLKYGDTYTIQKCDEVDRNARLWNIYDAKPGDVLASEVCDTIILFRGIKDGNIDFYCDYDFSEIGVSMSGDRFEVNNRGEHYGSVKDSEDFHPATKAQRDTLFTKMKGAGYEWDAVNKELKMIDSNWTENDRTILDGIIDEIEANKNSAPSYDLPVYDKYLNWLESLKKKIINE